MSCNIPVIKGVRNAADCKCYGAVMRAHRAMREDNVPENIAEEVAIRVYRHHHPEDKPRDAAVTVQRWLAAERHVH